MESSSFSQTEGAVVVLFVLLGYIYAGMCHRGKSWGQYNACTLLSVAYGLRMILCPAMNVTSN